MGVTSDYNEENLAGIDGYYLTKKKSNSENLNPHVPSNQSNKTMFATINLEKETQLKDTTNDCLNKEELNMHRCMTSQNITWTQMELNETTELTHTSLLLPKCS